LKDVEKNIFRNPQHIWMFKPIWFRLKIIHPQNRMLTCWNLPFGLFWRFKQSHGLSSIVIPVRMSIKLIKIGGKSWIRRLTQIS
jgi:hypothetical protein